MSVAPATGGFGYAVFEHPYGPVDWGVRHIPNRSHEEAMRKVRALVQWYQPTTVLVENFVGEGSRRAPRIQALIRSVALLVKDEEIELKAYSRGLVRQAFLESRGVRTKHAIADAISKEFREFTPYLPPQRKIWMSEDRRMQMFDAIALVLTHRHYEQQRQRRRA